MRTRMVVGCVMVAVVACGAVEPKTEELRGGRFVPITNATTQPTIDPVLVRIEDQIQQDHFSAARDLCVNWLLANKTSPQRDRGLYLMACALYGYGNRVKAFFYLDELMDEYPDSPLYYQALEKQYDIADAFLNGYKRRFLGLPLLSATEEAIEMMFRIQQRSPGSPLAAKALLRTADYYFKDGQYDLAADAYAAYARSYPRSPEIARVRLKKAFSDYAQFRGVKFDATPLVDARALLSDLMAQYPQFAAEENLSELIPRIDQTFARKLYVTADFYVRTHEPTAAVYLYRTLIQVYAQFPEAEQAKTQLAKMPQWALDSPPPGKNVIGLPTTQPSASARD